MLKNYYFSRCNLGVRFATFDHLQPLIVLAYDKG